VIVIYHNEECGTSRNVLSIIRDAGYEPTVIDYQKEGWAKSQLLGLFAAANLTPRNALRTSKSPAEELGLQSDDVTDDVLIEAMLAHPILVNRPIVCTPKSVKLCRPSEQVLDILENWPQGPYHKEDVQLMLDEFGSLVN
jgi:arsenate reductase (glutaredoxin)